MKPCVSVRCLGPQDRTHGKLRDTHWYAVAPRLAFAHSNVGERKIGEHVVCDEPIARAALSSSQIVPHNSEIIGGDMRKLRATAAFSHGPHVGSSPTDH
jgi:hypothetical protein